MEPADIDWNKVDSTFVKDDLYENFDAPKWVDLSSTATDNDNTWFCRPDCNHPKTAEGFLQKPPLTPPNHKVVVPFGERNASNNKNNHLQQREGKLKRRGVLLPPSSSPVHYSPKPRPASTKKKFRDDLENQNPNLVSPIANNPVVVGKKGAKETVKSSSEKFKNGEEGLLPPVQHRWRLTSALSARNLFGGKDILSQISEFCCEIKRLAIVKTRERPECYVAEDNKNNQNILGNDMNSTQFW